MSLQINEINTIMKNQGEQLRLQRRRLGLTKDDAARKLKVSRQTLSNYFHRMELPDEIIDNVKTNLGIDVSGALVKMQSKIEDYNKQGYSQSEHSYNDVQTTSLIKANASTSYAALELLIRLVSKAEDKPIEQVRKEVNQLTHERMKTIEQAMSLLISLP